MKTVFRLIVFCLLAQSIQAADINYPKEASSGSLIEVSVDQPTNESVVITPTFLERSTGVLETWTQKSLPWKNYDQQQHRYFVCSAGLGNRSLVLTVTTAASDADSKITYSSQIIHIRINDNGPIPPPNPPDPNPPVPPTPTPTPLPDDEFDNVGRSVQQFTSSLSKESRGKAKLTAQVYTEAADRLLKLPPEGFINASQSQAWLQVKRVEIWGDNVELKKFVEILQKPWSKYWPMEKAKVIEFYKIVAQGLQ